jgi:hypothetical protein
MTKCLRGFSFLQGYYNPQIQSGKHGENTQMIPALVLLNLMVLENQQLTLSVVKCPFQSIWKGHLSGHDVNCQRLKV